MKKFLNLFLITLTVVLIIQPKESYAQQKANKQLIETAKQNLLDNEFESAINKLNDYLRIYGFSRDAYYWRAHALLHVDRIDAAIIDLKLILMRFPKDSEALDAMGYAFNKKGEYITAIKWFNKAISKDDNNAIFYNNRGMSYYYLGKFNTAFHDFNKAVELDSTLAQAYSNRGSARYNHQDIKKASQIDLDKAESDFNKALELDSKLISAYRNRGLIRHEMKQFEKSLTDFKKAIYLDPNDPLIYFHVGNLMFDTEEYESAIRYYNESLKLEASQIEVLYKRALTYEALYMHDLARYDYETIIEQNHKERPICYFHIAKNYASEGNEDLAYFFLNKARKEDLFKHHTTYKKQLLEEAAFKDYLANANFIKLVEKIEKN